METYEKKYKDALKWIESIYTELSHERQMEAEAFFPELKESEDERIRRWCISHFKECINVIKDNDEYKEYLSNKVIAWLEKQGEQVLANSAKTCKVEPKFNVGDWVVLYNNHKSIYQIEKIENYQYIIRHILGGSMPLSFALENNIKLWTIQDAKDGDVLQLGKVTAIFKKYISNECCICYCSFCKDGGFEIPIANGEDNDYGYSNATPATKEQRDLLFQKMKEAGYEWDAEKKELRKIEQKSVEENKGNIGKTSSNWSEVDNVRLDEAIQMVESNGTWVRSDDAVKLVSDWLKSLKEKLTETKGGKI